MSTKVSTLVLTSNKLIPSSTEKFRGNIASKHLNNPLFHQHLQNSKLAYRYPLIPDVGRQQPRPHRKEGEIEPCP